MHARDGQGHAHATHEQRTETAPALRCQCRASGQPLAAFLIGTGLLPPCFELPRDIRTVVLAHATVEPSVFAPPTDTPPPRF